MSIGLLLVDEETLSPILAEGLPDETLADVPRPKEVGEMPDHLFNEGGDKENLALQRWGVIVPEQGGDELLAAIAPLIEARAKQQRLAPNESVRIYRVPKDLDPRLWMDENLKSSDKKRPRYLLILGDLDIVPLELQTALTASEYFTGRLAFDQIEHYTAYANKVLSWENPERTADGAQLTMLTALSSKLKDPTTDAYKNLMLPAVELLQKYQDDVEDGYAFDMANATTDPPPVSLGTLLTVAQQATRPTVLWTISHGSSVQGDTERVKRERGKLVFNGEYLTADLVKTGPFLPGGVWFMFACFGVATPRRSLYWQWLERALQGIARNQFTIEGAKRDALSPLATDAPFVSAMPRAALANPEGPLAIIGHADYAWTFSYADLPGTGAEARERFLRIPSYLADPNFNQRVGHAFSHFRDMSTLENTLNNHYAEIDEIEQQKKEAEKKSTTSADPAPARQPSIDPVTLGRLWMHRQDLVQYMILGDPAVRLPIKKQG